MKNVCQLAVMLLLILSGFSLSACSNHNDYPDEYVGFDKTSETFTFDKQADEQEISVKIIAGKKSEKDRTVTLNIRHNPTLNPAFKLTETKVTIPANKKKVETRILVYPKQMKQNQEIYLVCTPNIEGIKQSTLTLKLVLK